MLLLRSLTFNALFYVAMIMLMLVGLPALVLGRHATFKVAKAWSSASLRLLDAICGTRVEFRGVENIPEGGYIVAAKHQSFLETFALVQHVEDFSYILKRELTLIPVFGWYLKAADQIAIDRKSGRAALEQAIEMSRAALAQGRQILIFPEGTRRPVGAEPKYKMGVAHIYAATQAPCVPVALNTGLFWPRRKFLRRPGRVVIEFLEPIPPGLEKSEFLGLLQERIEAATDRLVAEAVQADASLAGLVARGA